MKTESRRTRIVFGLAICLTVTSVGALAEVPPPAPVEVRIERSVTLANQALAVKLIADPGTGGGVTGASESPAQILGEVTLKPEEPSTTVSLAVPESARLLVYAQGAWSTASQGRPYRVVLRPGADIAVRFHTKQPTLGLPPVTVARAWEVGAAEHTRDLRIPCVATKHGEGWSCATPPGAFDLRFDLPGFAPAFSWATDDAKVHGRSPRTVELLHGVSVEGWVSSANTVIASLRPPGRAEGLSPDRARFAQQQRRTDAAGHFQFPHVAPGTYDLSLESPGYQARHDAIRIRDGQEKVVLPEVSLVREITAQIQVTPPMDGLGEPWQVAVSRARDGGTAAVRRLTLDLTGWGELNELAPDTYLVIVRDSKGSTWHMDRHTIDDTSPLTIRLSHVAIEGQIRAGDKPVQADLLFGTTQGTRQIHFTTDEDGKFSGLLPHDGRWEVELTDPTTGCDMCGGPFGAVSIPPVDVEPGPDGTALVDIALPDTEVEGRVVRTTAEGDEPVPGAQLVVLRTEGSRASQGRKAQLWTKEDGSFHLRGLEPGPIRIGAFSPDRSAESEWVALDLRESVDSPEVVLRIEEKATLNVQVSAGGRPVAGARIYAFPDTGLSARASTGLDGRGSVRVPRGSSGPLFVDSVGEGLLLTTFDAGPSSSHDQMPPRTFDLSPAPGRLILEGLPAVPEPAWITSGAAVVPLNLVRNFAPRRLGVTDAGLILSGLQPGQYTIWLWSTNRCFTRTVPPNGEALVEQSAWKEVRP